jgi:DNA-binding transcriptional ArsR family regulator
MNTAILSDPFTLQASYFKALAHPVRLQILTILRQGEACVCHLEAVLQKRQAYISQQLMALKEAGLLAERKEGLFVFYSLADLHVATIMDSSLASLQSQSGGTIPLKIQMQLSGGRCACPTCNQGD